MTTFRFPLDTPLSQFVVRLGHGSVTIETDDDLDTATVELTAAKHSAELLAQTVVERRGKALVVVAPRQGGAFELPFLGKRAVRGLDLRATLPAGIDVKISTFTAPIWIAGRVGTADLSFGSGEAKVREVDGDLRLRFGTGLAEAVDVHGSVQLRSGAGNAAFGEIGGALVSGCGSGDVRVRRVHGPVRVRSGSGAALLGEVHGDVDLTTGSGQLEIGLPAGVTARLDLHAGAGRVRSELPIDDRPAGDHAPITLRARSGSGDVRIFRAA
jgi:hypothetical protein